MSGSTSRWRPRPPATPATLRSVRERRSRPRSRISSRVTRGPLSPGGSCGGGPDGASGGVRGHGTSLRRSRGSGPSGTPLILAGVADPWRSGSDRGQPSWSGVLRCVTIDLDMSSTRATADAGASVPMGSRRAYRDTQEPILGGVAVRARPPPRLPGALGARRLRARGASSAASASSSTPASGWLLPVRLPLRDRRPPASRAPPAAAAGPAGSAG